MTSPQWTAEARDRIYTELCKAVTQSADDESCSVPETRTELFLSRLCLLLIEELADAEAAGRALAEAKLPVDAVDRRTA